MDTSFSIYYQKKLPGKFLAQGWFFGALGSYTNLSPLSF